MHRRAAMVTRGYNRDGVDKLWLAAPQTEPPELIFPGAGKAPPLPNPKAEVEKMKAELKTQEMKLNFVEKLMELEEKQELSTAQIELLKAQAAKLLSEVGVEKAGAQIEAFEARIKAITDVDEAMRGHIDQLI